MSELGFIVGAAVACFISYTFGRAHGYHDGFASCVRVTRNLQGPEQ